MTPRPCPDGHYQEGFGARKVEECIKCPEGVYCIGEGLHYPPTFVVEGDSDGSEEDICKENLHFAESETCATHV